MYILPASPEELADKSQPNRHQTEGDELPRTQVTADEDPLFRLGGVAVLGDDPGDLRVGAQVDPVCGAQVGEHLCRFSPRTLSDACDLHGSEGGVRLLRA